MFANWLISLCRLWEETIDRSSGCWDYRIGTIGNYSISCLITIASWTFGLTANKHLDNKVPSLGVASDLIPPRIKKGSEEAVINCLLSLSGITFGNQQNAGGCHGRLRQSIARSHHAQVPLHRFELLTSSSKSRPLPLDTLLTLL